MQDTLAEYGSWKQENAADVSAEEALKLLVQRIPDSIKDPREMILATLRMQMEKENLRFRNRNGIIEWGWVDYL